MTDIKIKWRECRDGMDDSDFENGYKNHSASVRCPNGTLIFANVEGNSEYGSWAVWEQGEDIYNEGEEKSYRSAKIRANKKIKEFILRNS